LHYSADWQQSPRAHHALSNVSRMLPMTSNTLLLR
jgi:hypothetical protein